MAAVSAWQGRGQWQRFSIALCCEGVGVFACFSAEELRRKWRELVSCQLGPAVSLESMYKWKCEESADESGKIGEGVYMNRALEDVADTIEILARLLEEGGAVEDRRAAKKKSVAAWAKPCVRIAGNPVWKLTMLLEIATAINMSNSGFFSLTDSHALAAEGYKDSGVRYPFDKKPAVLLDCLLRYLLVISVSVTEDVTIISLCTRPAQSEGFIR